MSTSSSKSKPKMRIYRRYLTYHLLDAKTIQVTERYNIWIPAKKGWWIHGLHDYVPNLEIKNSDGESLPVLSDHELDHFIRKANPSIFTESQPIVSQDILRHLCGEEVETMTRINTPTDHLENQLEPELKHFVAIILPTRTKNYFEEITIKYILPIEKSSISYDLISRHLEVTRTIPRTTTNSDYINITTSNKFVLSGKKAEIIIDKNKEIVPTNDEIKPLLNNTTRCVYRIKRGYKHSVEFKWKIAIPPMVILWAWVGLLFSIGTLIVSWVIFDIKNFESFKFSVGLVAGVVTLILGFHKILLHDSELMVWWNRMYLIILAIAVLSVLYMAHIVQW